MNARLILVSSFLALTFAAGVWLLSDSTADTSLDKSSDHSSSAARPADTIAPKVDIYDEKADGAEQIAQALPIAREEHKLVLVQFGANWCVWCHLLHDTFATNPAVAAKLAANFVVVLVDVNNDHNRATVDKYGNPTRFGLPVIVLLDADGRQLTTKNTGELEEGDHHSPQKILAFLNAWAPTKNPAAS